MPIANYTTAHDEILTFIKEGWDAVASAQGLTDVVLVYEDNENDTLEDGTYPDDFPETGSRVEIFIDDGRSERSTLQGEMGARRFRRTGFVECNIYTPLGDGLRTSDKIRDVLVDIFEGERTGLDRVDFRDNRHKNIGVYRKWYRVRLRTTFEWDTVK